MEGDLRHRGCSGQTKLSPPAPACAGWAAYSGHPIIPMLSSAETTGILEKNCGRRGAAGGDGPDSHRPPPLLAALYHVELLPSRVRSGAHPAGRPCTAGGADVRTPIPLGALAGRQSSDASIPEHATVGRRDGPTSLPDRTPVRPSACPAVACSGRTDVSQRGKDGTAGGEHPPSRPHKPHVNPLERSRCMMSGPQVPSCHRTDGGTSQAAV